MAARKKMILVADDDAQLRRLISNSLELAGFHVLTASDGDETLKIFEAQSLDLVLLDVMMPKLDGFSVCQQVREISSIPIIILTACGHDDDKVKGLNLGADDYLTKPFHTEELIARVHAVLRRTESPTQQPSPGTDTVIIIGQLTIDCTQHLVTRRDQEVLLTPTEYRLLEYLVLNAGRAITQDTLLEHIWGEDYLGEYHMLQVNINRIRRKIEEDPTHPRYILTKVGIGYKCAIRSENS